MFLYVVLFFLFTAVISDATPPQKGYSPTKEERARQDLVRILESKKNLFCPDIKDLPCPRPEVTFWLYTRDTWDKPVKLDPFNVGKNNPGFVPGVPLKVLIHGYTQNKDTSINEVLRPAYFARASYNIVSVDWSSLARDHCYVQAANSVPTVARCVTLMISTILEHYGHMFKDVHLLGHSMGAHISAWASQDLHLPRCTLLDPALPVFTNNDKLMKHAKAGLVDVWHSNTEIYGRVTPSGQVDIYFNDEMDQPGCYCDTSCSHLRAVQYYAETISGKTPLFAFPCAEGWQGYRFDQCPMPEPEDINQFGEQYTADSFGVYLAFTNDASPFLIPEESYLNKKTFKSFKKTRDEKCRRHKFIGFFVDLFEL